MEALEKWVRIRIRLVGCIFLLVFGAIAVRAFCLQVLNQKKWQHLAEKQQQRIIPLLPERGTIYDRNGEEMALSIEEDSIYVQPAKVVDADGESRVLSRTLALPFARVHADLTARKDFRWVKRQVSFDASRRLRALKLPGIGFIKEYRRFYPNSSVGAQMIGFTGLDPRGLEGLELKYDSLLLGQGGYLVTAHDALGRGMGSGQPVVEGESRGSDLYLTLDKNLQYIAQKELAAGVRACGAKDGTVVVMDPRTGQILAMASQPDYNPNAFGKYRPADWRDRGICDTFEPGSTFKLILLSAALNEKVVTPQEHFFCENGSYAVGGRVIHDHKPYGTLTVAQVLQHSSNIGAAKIGAKLGRERFYQYIRAFGFGSPTGVDLPGEVAGLVRKPADWFDVDLANISFGQGISVTALQLATAVSAIANGGNLMRPYVVQKVVDSFGETVRETDPKVVRRVISARTAHKMLSMMELVTDEEGTGRLAAVPGYLVAGKTGTAQKVDPVTGRYSDQKMVTSFIGAVPASAPRLVIFVVVDEPKIDAYGGLAAAPIFSRIAGQALSYLKVPPTRIEAHNPLPPPAAAAAAARFPVPVQRPVAADGGAPRMPDFLGMSYRQVLQTMARTGLNVKLKGSGRVVEQQPAPGRTIRYGSPVWVRLAPPG